MSSSGVNLENYLIPLEEIIRATENFSKQTYIGAGGFGEVYKGQLSERWGNRTAAIKRRGKDSYQGEHEFRNELEMISNFKHENIISFIGYCHEDREMILVFEYASGKSLDYHLENKMPSMTWIQRLKICIGAARGLNYLHSGLGEHRVIHRDVKSANILLDSHFEAKVCDFGLSKLGPRYQQHTELHTNLAGTEYYIDPTYHESRILRKESDVYSFGVVLFEILSGMPVYRQRSIGGEPQFLMNSVRRYQKEEPDKLIDPVIRDQIDRRSFNTFKEIAYQCISFNVMQRPSMDTVTEIIVEALTIQMRSATINAQRSMVESLVRKLNSDDPYDQRTAAGEISMLSELNAYNRIIFAEYGAIPLLIQLLTAPDSGTQENALTALLNLSNFEVNRDSIVISSAVSSIIHVLKQGSMKARENAAATLSNGCKIDENKVIIGDAGAIPPLLLLLSEGTQKGKKESITALFSLCLYEGNKGRMVKAGAIPILMEILTERWGVCKDEVLAILAILSTDEEGNFAIGKAKVVPVLVEVIGDEFYPNNQENALVVLVELCSRDQKYLLEAQKHGIERRLSRVLFFGTDKGKTKARQLRDMTKCHPSDDSVTVNSVKPAGRAEVGNTGFGLSLRRPPTPKSWNRCFEGPMHVILYFSDLFQEKIVNLRKN